MMTSVVAATNPQPLNYALLVTGPVYGQQAALSAYQFAGALLARGHRISQVFFYRDGVLNANALTAPASDEFHLVNAWRDLAAVHDIALNVCVAAALRRGVVDAAQAEQEQLSAANLHPAFTLAGLGELAQAALTCDRVVQF